MFFSRGGPSKFRGWLMIWHVVVWLIWKTRNDMVFLEKLASSKNMKDMTVLLAWNWYLGRYVGNLWAFSARLKNPFQHLSQYQHQCLRPLLGLLLLHSGDCCRFSRVFGWGDLTGDLLVLLVFVFQQLFTLILVLSFLVGFLWCFSYLIVVSFFYYSFGCLGIFCVTSLDL